LNTRLDSMTLFFVLECESIMDQLHACGDKSLTEASLAEKILHKRPGSMSNLVSQIRTIVTVNKEALSLSLLKDLFQTYDTSKRLQAAQLRLQNGSPAETTHALVAPTDQKTLVAEIKSLFNQVKQLTQAGKRKKKHDKRHNSTSDSEKGEEKTASAKRKRETNTCPNCDKPGHNFESCWDDGSGAEQSRPEWSIPKSQKGRKDKKLKGINRILPNLARLH
jgi:hypothetical protein